MWQMLSMSIASCLVEEFGVYTINNKDRKGGRSTQQGEREAMAQSPSSPIQGLGCV